MSPVLSRRHLATLMLALVALPATAQDAGGSCRAYVAGQWQELGRGALDACLKAVDQVVENYDEQGFKFAASGTTMLASDPNYFYQSIDRGQQWTLLGRKSEMKQRLAVAPLLGKPAPGVATTVATAPAPELRSCSVLVDGVWQTTDSVTLQDCTAQLDLTADQFDSVGYKYSYWGKLFLAADKDQILRSDNGTNWTPISARAPRP